MPTHFTFALPSKSSNVPGINTSAFFFRYWTVVKAAGDGYRRLITRFMLKLNAFAAVAIAAVARL
jgi:hypothetical protein